jgi:CRISPR system Cascade subunit CasB
VNRQHIEAFIRHLETLRGGKDAQATRGGENRAAMAALRRALSGEARDVLPAYRHIGRLLPADERERDRCILIAALFADHPRSTSDSKSNMGRHLAELYQVDPGRRQSVERRFAMLLASHPDDLALHLRHAVGLLKSAQVPINWARLLSDVLWWEKGRGKVQRRWAYAFWGPETAPPALDSLKENTDSLEDNSGLVEAGY